MRKPALTFVARRVARDKILYQLAVQYPSRNRGVEQVQTLFPHRLVDERMVKSLGYSPEHIKARKGF